MIVKYKEIRGIDIGGGITRRVLAHGGKMMIVEAAFRKGAVGEPHRHSHEQVSYILAGKFRYTMDGQTYILEKGDTYYVPPEAFHGAEALEDSIILDIFTPQREDFVAAHVEE